MASMNRNVDLEEIDNDAPLGLEFLKYQTLLQKIWMISMIIGGVTLMLVGTFILKIDTNICIWFVFIPLALGVLFGANYNQDFTVFQYIAHSLKKSSIKFMFKSTESKNGLKRIKEYENAIYNSDENNKDFDLYLEGVKKRLVRFSIIFISLLAVVAIYKAIKDKNAKNMQHHIAYVNSVNVVVEEHKDVVLL